MESIPYTTASQTFTISKTGEKWFVSFGIEASQLPVHPLLDERQDETFGIDVGVKQFASIANQELGNSEVFSLPDSIKIEQLKLAKKIEQLKLAKFQWRNRNKQLGSKGKPPSKNAIKYYKKLAFYHTRIANIRRDFVEKTTTLLVSQVKHIYLLREFECERDDAKR